MGNVIEFPRARSYKDYENSTPPVAVIGSLGDGRKTWREANDLDLQVMMDFPLSGPWTLDNVRSQMKGLERSGVGRIINYLRSCGFTKPMDLWFTVMHNNKRKAVRFDLQKWQFVEISHWLKWPVYWCW